MKNESREAEIEARIERYDLAADWLNSTLEDLPTNALGQRYNPETEAAIKLAQDKDRSDFRYLLDSIRDLEALAVGLAKAARLLVDESERILFSKQENGGDYPGLALALSRMNYALLSKAAKSQEVG